MILISAAKTALDITGRLLFGNAVLGVHGGGGSPKRQLGRAQAVHKGN